MLFYVLALLLDSLAAQLAAEAAYHVRDLLVPLLVPPHLLRQVRRGLPLVVLLVHRRARLEQHLRRQARSAPRAGRLRRLRNCGKPGSVNPIASVSF